MMGSLLAACGGGGGGGGGTPTLTWYAFPEPGGSFDAAVERCNDEAGGRYRIRLADLPSNPDGQREQLVRRLAAQDKDIDITILDVIWTAEFAEAGWILPWQGEAADRVTDDVLKGPLETATFKDQLWAAPLTSNTQLLWYRKDLVQQPPTTWNEMVQEAERQNKLVQVQGARAEGLTVWFNSLVQSAGGQIVESGADEPQITVGGQPTTEALEVMRNVAASKAADPSLPTNKEDEGRLAFETGNTVFMVNWPFVYPSAQKNAPDIGRNMGYARYPQVVEGQQSRPPLGGVNLAVGAYSRHPDLAFDAAACLVEDETQLFAAKEGGLPPTRARLYDDPGLREEYPFADLLRESINDAAPRPVSPAYNDISRAIYTTVHPLASVDPEADAEALRAKVEKVTTSGGLL